MKSISTLFRQLSLIVVLISAFSLSAWGGEEIISNTFSSTTMQKSVSSYTDTWNNISGIELKLANFNNNQKKWTYVKCGRKNTTSIGTITTTSPLTEKITKVEVTIDAVTTSKINSTYLQVASDASFTQNVQKVIVTIATGTITYEIPTPTSNCYYRLTYDCASGSSNGLVTISKVNFYYNTGESGGGETTATPLSSPTINAATNITSTGFTANWTDVDNESGYKISIDGKTYDEVAANVTSCNITGLKSETEYTYTITAVGDGTNYSDTQSSEATVTTRTIEVANIAEFLALKDKENNVTITNPVTIVAQDKDQKRIWVQDNSGAIMIYSSPALDMEYTAGQQFTNLKGKYAEYNGSTQLQTTELPVATEGQVPTPTEATLENIVDNMNNYIHKYVKINDISYDGTAISDGTNSLSLYDHFGTDLSNVNKEYKANVEGIVGYYNTNQFYILKYEEIIPIIPTISTNVTTIDFNDVKQGATSDKNFTIEFYNLTSEINIECDNSSFNLTTEEVSESEWSVEITFNAPTQVGIQEGTITISSEGAKPKTVTLTANVYEAYTIKFGNTEKETNAEGKVTEIPTLDGVVGWTTNSVFAIVDEKPNVINENTIFEENTQLYPVYSITEEGQGEEAWTLVTDASTLAVGDQVVIAAANYNYALSTTQNNNNRGSVAITKNGDVITINNDVQILTLEEGTTSVTFAFNTGSGYLYAASNSSNHLKTQESIKANGSWSIEISNKIATIKAQENDRNWMRFNNNNSPKIFSCYASGQTDIALYKKTGGAITKYNIAGNKTVDNNTTFDVKNNININILTIKSNPDDEAGEVNVTAGALSANKVIIEKTIDASRWFFFSLPFDCNVADIVATYVNGGAELEYAPDASTGDYVIAEYDGTNSWVELLGDNKPTLKANQGYIIGHFGSGDVTVKFPSADAQVISAPANATLEKTSDNGFNLIGLPYFQKVTNAGLNVEYVSIPNVSNPNEYGTYTQEKYAEIIASIAPFTSFFVQTEAENIEFTLGAQQNAAPRLDGRSNQASLHKAVVTLTDANGGADRTTIINDPSKTTDYEIGHDLTKLIGYAEIPQIYSLQGDEMLAFNSLAIDNSTVIPLGVYAHADGDYTFALSEKSVGDLEGWELYDNETGKTTRLANEDLTVNLAQGTHEGRFEIRLQQRISTDCDNAMGDMTTWTANGTLNINNLPADAVVYIYDAVGRMVYVANNNSTTFNYTFAARGVYNIVVRTAENSASFKTIY